MYTKIIPPYIFILSLFTSIVLANITSLTKASDTKRLPAGYLWTKFDCIAGTASQPVLLEPNLINPQPYFLDGLQYWFCLDADDVICAAKYYYDTNTNSVSPLIYDQLTGHVYFNPNYAGGLNAAVLNFVDAVYCPDGQ